MGLNHGAKIVTNGLVLCLDAANKKSYIQYSTFLNMSSWAAGSGGVSPYNANQNGDENLRLVGTNPWGQSAIVWQSMPSGNSDPDGGWNTNGFTIDKTKLYRFSVWVKRISDSTSGNFYFGINPCVIRNDNSTEECNPYWECSGIGSYAKDLWILVVGHCFPYTYTGGSHPDSGAYTTSGRYRNTYGCNTGTGDVRWKSDSTYTAHRTYHFYSPDTTSHLQFYDPRIDLVDGTEPSIKQLWSQSTLTFKDMSGKNNNGTLTTAITYNSSNNGSLVFNGINDTIKITTSENDSLDIRTKLTLNIWFNSIGSLSSFKYLISKNVNSGYGDHQYAVLLSNGTVIEFLLMETTLSQSFEFYLNTWYMVTCTWDGSTKKIYINGADLGGSQVHTNSLTFKPNFRINGRYNGDEIFLIDGKIPSVQIYNRALSSTEILQNYNATKGRYGL